MDVIIFILALSVLIMVHEFGHYFAAIKTGVKVEEFGLGLPPRIVGKKIGKTIFSLNWLPIGGFCKLYGEDGDGKGGEAFNHKKPWQKALVVLGVVIMNLVLAISIFAVVYAIVGIPIKTEKVKVSLIAKNSPAESIGLKEGDWIQKVGGVEVKTPDQLTIEVGKFKGKKVELTILDNNGKSHIYSVEARENPPAGEGSLGIAITNSEIEKIKWYEINKSVPIGFKTAISYSRLILVGLGQMVVNVFSGHVPKDVAGPIGMYQLTSQIRQSDGVLGLLNFFGIISVNLAVVNVLPFPALDGGRIVFVLYEMITRRKANQKFEGMVNTVGMVFLLGLILLITVGDVWRIIFN